MENYIKINVIKYVRDGIENGTLIPFKAQKYARIIARQGTPGETIISYSEDANGNEITERVSKISLDNKTHKPGWVATKVDSDGNIILDKHNHPNEWIISDSTFKRKYEIDPVNPNLYKPKGGIQLFVQIPDNIILEQWGSEMKIVSGGYINITNVDDMYGVSERDFYDTYKIIGNLEEENKKSM